MSNPSQSKKLKGKQSDLRYFMLNKRKFQETSSPSSVNIDVSGSNVNNVPLEDDELVYDAELLTYDPGKRTSIMDYPPNDRNSVRRAYILKNPCQPITHNFPTREIGGPRRFSVSWFRKLDWLEYSIEKDAAFCFVCYLFKNEVEANVGGDAFVNGGFRSWNKPDRLQKHVGGLKSAHNLTYEKYVNLRDDKKKSIHVAFGNVNEVIQRLAFRRHRVNEESLNRANFIELLKWLREYNEDVSKVTFENALGNCQLTSPTIQKDIITCCAKETTKRIIEDLGGDYFAILADESSDVSQKEQLALCLRYIERKKGKIVERFLGLVHVSDTTALTLKNAIKSLLDEHSLSSSNIRGQGYDGASNMKGEINGLKTLIMAETPSAYYVHCYFLSFRFSNTDLMTLDCQLDIFTNDVQNDIEFENRSDVTSLSMKLVDKNRHMTYPLVFLLIKLVLIMPVATSNVERVFSRSMTYVKNKLRNSMGNQVLNDCLVTFIEKDVFLQVPDDTIIERYQDMAFRRVLLDRDLVYD